LSGNGDYRKAFVAGTRVRVKQDAFSDSDYSGCLQLRGQTGTLILRIGVVQREILWVWKGDCGEFAYLLDHEFEVAYNFDGFPI